MRRAAAAAAIAAFMALAAPEAIATVESESAGEKDGHHVPHAPHVNWTKGLFDLSHHSADADANEPGVQPMNPPFLAMIINFAIFLGLLVWKAGPPLTSYLARRHDEVKGALEEAARMQKEAAAALAERKKKLAAVDAEVDELIDGMRRDADSEKTRLIAESETASAALKRDAEGRIAATATRARQAIEADVIAAAVEAAEALIREQATADDHNALVERFIDSLTDGTFGGGSPAKPPDAVDEGWS